MHVEAAKARRVENGFWQKQAIGYDNRRVRAVCAECMLCGRVLESLQRMNRKRQAPGFALHWSRLQFQTAPRQPGRARVDGDYVVSTRGEFEQRRHCEVGSAHEDQAQWHYSSGRRSSV